MPIIQFTILFQICKSGHGRSRSDPLVNLLTRQPNNECKPQQAAPEKTPELKDTRDTKKNNSKMSDKKGGDLESNAMVKREEKKKNNNKGSGGRDQEKAGDGGGDGGEVVTDPRFDAAL